MHIVWLEPFYGGSHRSILDHYIDHSSHSVTRITLPARHWKWRLRGSAYYFLRELRSRFPDDSTALPDCIICSSLTDVSLVRSLWPPAVHIPVALYVHEHQFTYPTRSGLTPDANYPLTDFGSAASADCVFFNSQYCLESFFEGARALFARMPDARCADIIDETYAKSRVLYPGGNPVCDVPVEPDSEPIILWNHRWEHDKCPDEFFAALSRLDRPDLPWKLAVTGGRYRGTPDVFNTACSQFSHRIVQWGYVESVEKYRRLVSRCHVVVSTANQENFGLSVLEAVRSGLLPVLPRALSYEELYSEIGARFYDAGDARPHGAAGPQGAGRPQALADAIEAALSSREALRGQSRDRRRLWAQQFDWASRAPVWDEAFSRLQRRAEAYGI